MAMSYGFDVNGLIPRYELGGGYARGTTGKLSKLNDRAEYEDVLNEQGFRAYAPGYTPPETYAAANNARDITNDPRLAAVEAPRERSVGLSFGGGGGGGEDAANEPSTPMAPYRKYNGQELVEFNPDYWTKKSFYGLDSLEPYRQQGLNSIVKIGKQYYIPKAAADQANAALEPYSNQPSSFDNFMEGLFSAGPMIAASAFLGPAIAGSIGGAGAGAMASADAIGLAQMGQAAGLTGSALTEFVASGGTLGSTAAGVAGSMPPSYWSMLADNSGVGAPSAAAGTMSADALGLQQMGQAAGLTGNALAEFVAQGGAASVGIPAAGFDWAANAGGLDSAMADTANAYTSNMGVNNPLTTAGGATGIAGLLQQLSTLTGLPTSAIERLGGAGISSLASMYGARKLGQASMDAANRVAAANQSATQLQSQMYQDQVARQQPFYQAGLNALPSYTKGVMPGGDLVRPFAATDFQADPGYGFRMSEGLKALDRSAASRGNLLSGATLKGAQRFGQDIASNEYNNAYNRYVGNQATQRNALAGLTGFAPTAAQQIGNAGSNYATNAGNLGISTATNYGNADMTGAAARQSAYMGAGGAFANALSPNPLNAYLNKQLGIA